MSVVVSLEPLNEVTKNLCAKLDLKSAHFAHQKGITHNNSNDMKCP